MDPRLSDALEELRQAGAYMPGSLPATGFGMPNLADLPRNVPMSAMYGIPAPDQQADVIAEIKDMMASSDPQQRARAQAYMDRFGRNLFAVGLNRATAPLGSDRGLSDYLLGLDQTGAYGPEAMDYSKRLTRGVRP